MKWLWIDPGETVGWARGIAGPAKLLVEDYGQHKSKTFALKLLESAGDYDLVGYESYAITQNKAQAHVGSSVPTIQVIGMIRLAVWVAQAKRGDGFPIIASQEPRQKRTGMTAAVNYVSPEIVHEIRAALSGFHDEGHYGDALLHAIAWYHQGGGH